VIAEDRVYAILRDAPGGRLKILVFCPNWVGDAVMATPTLRALRKLGFASRIIGAMRPQIRATLAGNPWFDDVIIYDHRSTDKRRRTWRIIRRIRTERFDVGLLLSNSIRSALVSWLGGVKRRVGYSRDGRRILLNDPLPVPRTRRGAVSLPMIDYYLALAYHLGAPPESYAMELFTSPWDEQQADALWERFRFKPTDRIVALNPGAAYGPAKRWPSPYFSELARRLVDSFGVKVVILCGPQEQGFARFIADGAMRPSRVKSLADEPVSIGLSKVVVRRSVLLVSTDSGPRHFAAPFAVPVVSLFGPTPIELTDTHYAQETHLQKKLACGPCQQRICPLRHHRCMQELSVDEVFAAAAHWLAQADRWAG
jgi:heptosyltransferase-2